MKTKALRLFSILMLVILILALVMLTAGAIAKSNLAKQYPAPDQLVDVGGYKMHIHCIGQGSPTIILVAGNSDFSVTWAYVQPQVAQYTRVCSYDRAGLGWSEPSPHPRTANTMVEELHTLLVNANVQGPYVLVGHSLGGLLVRVYAHNYPDEVVGMVLVDSAHEEYPLRLAALGLPDFAEKYARSFEQAAGQNRLYAFLSSTGIMALAPNNIPNLGLPDEAYAQWQAVFATTGFFNTALAETNAIDGMFAETRALRIVSLGSMPLVVLSAGLWEPDPAYSDAENQRIREAIQVMQSDLAVLSSDSQHIIAQQSGHFIQLDQPYLVIDAIRQVSEATQ